MESDTQIAMDAKFVKGDWISFDEVVISYSSQYNETSSQLKNLLNPDPKTTGQGWNSGSHAPGWIKIDLKEYAFVENICLLVNISPNCDVHYICEFELVHDVNQTKRKIVDETTEVHWHGKKINIQVGCIIKSVLIKTISSKSWIAWSKILLKRKKED